jgi:ABC-type amino acid transport substrate-binding protein
MRFFSTLRRTACTISLLVLAATPAIAGEKLRVAVENEYKPFSYNDEQGRLRGFDVDLTQALCARMERECKITPMLFEDILPAMGKDEFDFAAVGFGITPEREQIVLFTEHYYRSHSIFIGKPGAVQGLAPEDLKGKRVGVQSSSIQEKHLKKAYGSTITLVPQQEFDSLFKDLQADVSDIILTDGLSGYEMLKGPLGTGLETVGEPVTDEFVNTSAHMAVSKKQPLLRDAINEAIKALVRDGEYAKISRKYFDFDVY